LDCRSVDLARFAQLGSIYIESLRGIKEPRVGLISVGREATKGNKLIQETHELLKTLPLNFIGNIEGSDIPAGIAEVLVCDGFTGNVVLKNYEYVGKQAVHVLDQLATEKGLTEELKEIREKLFFYYDLNSRGGANFLGTNKIVIKMHGAATEDTVFACIQLAKETDDGGYIEKLQNTVLV